MRISLFLDRHRRNLSNQLTDHPTKSQRRNRTEAGLTTTEMVFVLLGLLVLAGVVVAFLGGYVQALLDRLP